VENVRVEDAGLVAEAGKTGVIVWEMRRPYVVTEPVGSVTQRFRIAVGP
jgi:hypothetical protein